MHLATWIPYMPPPVSHHSELQDSEQFLSLLPRKPVLCIFLGVLVPPRERVGGWVGGGGGGGQKAEHGPMSAQHLPPPQPNRECSEILKPGGVGLKTLEQLA